MKRLLFKTTDSVAPLFLRVFLALVLFPHGAQKLLGWFGGFGFDGSMQYFTETVGLPKVVGFAIILIEFFGPLAILAGFAVRFWSLAIAGLMTGILFTNFTDHFFMNWFGNQKTEGMEYFLLFIGMSLSLVYSGAGRFSIDATLKTVETKKRQSSKSFIPA